MRRSSDADTERNASYTEFRLSDLQFDASTIAPDGRVTVSAIVQNVGSRDGDEVVQLYVSDLIRSLAPPVQELKGFQRITLRAGESRRVSFPLSSEHLGFYDRQMKWIVEPGEFRIRVSNSSVGGLTAPLVVR